MSSSSTNNGISGSSTAKDFEYQNAMSDGIAVMLGDRPYTEMGQARGGSTSRTWSAVKHIKESEGCLSQRSTARSCSSLASLAKRAHPVSRRTHDDSFDKRKVDLRLPSFNTLGISSNGTLDSIHIFKGSLKSSVTATGVGVVPLLTPPQDDSQVKKTIGPTPSVISYGCSSGNTPPGLSSPEQNRDDGNPDRSTDSVGTPSSRLASDQSQKQSCLWTMRVARRIWSTLTIEGPLHQVQMISQTMPSQAKDSRLKPTFEEVLEVVSGETDAAPFITITHAVPQVRVMEEVPKTPPQTPNAMHNANDYFGSDQTMFTHAAVVPIYHNHDPAEARSAFRMPHRIAAPYSVQISILERYIPPTMPEEVSEFFSLSGRSYLADRLFELSAHNGSLLLVYPTKLGGRTFARRYIGPIIEPYLRQFIMLNSLTSDAAVAMGKMTAVDEMLGFEEMKRRVTNMCSALTQGPAVRGTKTAYQISHCETTEVVIDRSSWVHWFVEQEQSRLRQNLIAYHQAGGRMPGTRDHREVTVGMLTREVVEGIQKSKEVAGDAGIEVGVFVITRTAV